MVFGPNVFTSQCFLGAPQSYGYKQATIVCYDRIYESNKINMNHVIRLHEQVNTCQSLLKQQETQILTKISNPHTQHTTSRGFSFLGQVSWAGHQRTQRKAEEALDAEVPG